MDINISNNKVGDHGNLKASG